MPLKTSLKSLVSTFTLLLVFTASLATAQVQGDNARVVVPDVPGGALVSGCYKADRNLYGPYRLTFCLQRRGIYAIRSDTLTCDGRLTWSTPGRDVNINLRRQSCNRGLAWAEANIVCRPRSALDLLLDHFFGQKPRHDSNGRVVVPDNPRVKKLTCTYRPTVAGNKTASFFAILQ